MEGGSVRDDRPPTRAENLTSTPPVTTEDDVLYRLKVIDRGELRMSSCVRRRKVFGLLVVLHWPGRRDSFGPRRCRRLGRTEVSRISGESLLDPCLQLLRA